MELKQGFSVGFGTTNRLLIVPYGIETQHGRPVSSHQHGLLIVPYGIETRIGQKDNVTVYTFNRTLWN